MNDETFGDNFISMMQIRNDNTKENYIIVRLKAYKRCLSSNHY